MPSRNALVAVPPPLLVWREVSEIQRIENELAALKARMEKLKPHSHARVELQYRARLLRARQLKIEAQLKGSVS